MNNVLKSLYISLFPLFALYIVIQQLTYSYSNNFRDSSQIGNLISSLTIVAFFIGLFIKKRARTTTSLYSYTFLVFTGFIVTIIINYNSFNKNSNHLLFGSLLFIGWIVYLKWYSYFRSKNTNLLSVGNKLPAFELENSDKEKVSSDFFLNNPTIFLFYRGNWCPLCMAQIKEVVDEYKELEKRNVNVVLISPQPHKFSKSLANKHQVPFYFLTDKNNITAKKLGIIHKNGIPAGFQVLGYDSDTVLPTIIITNKNGAIIYSDLTSNYRVRPEPKEFIKVLDENLI